MDIDESIDLASLDFANSLWTNAGKVSSIAHALSNADDPKTIIRLVIKHNIVSSSDISRRPGQCIPVLVSCPICRTPLLITVVSTIQK